MYGSERFQQAVAKEEEKRIAKIEEARRKLENMNTGIKNRKQPIEAEAQIRGMTYDELIEKLTQKNIAESERQYILQALARKFHYASVGDYLADIEERTEKNTHPWGGGMTKGQWQALNPENHNTSVVSNTGDRRIPNRDWDPAFKWVGKMERDLKKKGKRNNK